MSRGLVLANANAVEAGTVRPVYLVKAEFDSGNTLVWTGVGDLSFNSETYLGVGDLLNISSFSEQTDLRAASFSVSLKVNTTNLNLAQSEDYQNRFLTVFVGFLDEDSSLIADPQVFLKGFMDQITITIGDGQANIEVRCENRLVDLDRPRRRLYTDAEQKSLDSTDKAFEYVAAIQDLKINWGQAG